MLPLKQFSGAVVLITKNTPARQWHYLLRLVLKKASPSFFFYLDFTAIANIAISSVKPSVPSAFSSSAVNFWKTATRL